MYYEWLATLLTLVLGLVLPLLANFVPIYRAVTNTLRDSLDLYHQMATETKVTFTKLSTMGVSMTSSFCFLFFFFYV
jgi:ABC-type sulfate transport system permease component